MNVPAVAERKQETYAFFLGAAFFLGLAGLDLPNDPWNIFPFFVFLSPLPILINLYVLKKIKVNFKTLNAC